MKKRLVASYVSGILNTRDGERYAKIFYYFAPEFITAFLLYSLPMLLDAYFISSLKSTSTYATSGITNVLIHLVVKLAEGISVGTLVLAGNFNGAGEYKNAGRSMRDAFWLSCLAGLICATALYFGAYWIYYLYGVPEKMIALGVPFLRLHAISLFFMFISFSFVGFLRGVKNTRTPMIAFVIGIIAFIIGDYLLIFGYGGFAPMGLQGSAIASIIRYFIMAMCLLTYTLFHPANRKYNIKLFSFFYDVHYLKRLLFLSIPVMFDKAIMAFGYTWLGIMQCTIGTTGAAAFCVIKDLERVAILPAVAFAQVITLLVSNDFGKNNWVSIKTNIKKIVFITSIMVFIILLIFSLFPSVIIQLFDPKNRFTSLAAYAFPLLSVLVFFDLLQLILSGALRGCGNVKLVMLVRLAVLVLYFMPISYFISTFSFITPELRFILIYASFYFGNALMSIIYVYRFRGERWKTKTV